MLIDEYVETLTSDELAQYGRLAAIDTLDIMRPDIVGNALGGTQITYRLSFRDNKDGTTKDILTDRYISGMPDPENGAYDYEEIADGKHEDSKTTGLSVIELLRDEIPCRSDYHGNVVLPISVNTDLVASGSGLAEEGDAAFCAVLAGNFYRRLCIGWLKARNTH